jgi:ribosomal-protein-alanine N-acetyltransferase
VNPMERPDQTIRPMQLADLEQVHQIDTASFSLPWPRSSFLFELNENPVSRSWVVECELLDGQRKIIAVLVLWLIIDEAHIATIAVHPDYRRRGIGRRLLVHALLEAAREGAQRSFLEVRRANTAAQDLYQRFGFTIVGIRPHYYRDNGEDAILMNLEPIQPEALRLLLEEY